MVLHSSINTVMFYRRSYFFQVINRVGNSTDFVHKQSKGFVKWATHLHPIFPGVQTVQGVDVADNKKGINKAPTR